MLFGGREAEALLLDDLSIGSAHDLDRATNIARALVEEFGMGGDAVGVRQYTWPGQEHPPQLSEVGRGAIEASVLEILDRERARAKQIVTENRALLISLRDLLLEKKVLDRESFGHLVPSPPVGRGSG